MDVNDIGELECPNSAFDPLQPSTTMVLAHDRRVIMCPGRNHTVLGLGGLLPDENLRELSQSGSWNSLGGFDKLLKSFADSPSWV